MLHPLMWVSLKKLKTKKNLIIKIDTPNYGVILICFKSNAPSTPHVRERNIAPKTL